MGEPMHVGRGRECMGNSVPSQCCWKPKTALKNIVFKTKTLLIFEDNFFSPSNV